MRVPFTTPAELQDDGSLGFDVSALGPNVNRILAIASDLVEGAMGVDFAYRQIVGEMLDANHITEGHWYGPVGYMATRPWYALADYTATGPWRGMYLTHAPIRAITGITLLQGGSIPVSDVIINTERDAFMVAKPLATYLTLPPVFGVRYRLDLQVTYSAGYDNGAVQTDGLSVPAPDWLQDATLLTALSMCTQIERNTEGLNGVTQTRLGVVVQKLRDQGDFAVPPSALTILNKRNLHSEVTIA